MHILIDGKNLLYRSIYVNSNTHPFVVASRMMHSYLHKFNYGQMHVFWDDNKENLWRRELLPDYKEAECRDKSKIITSEVDANQAICEDFWDNMNIIQYKRNHIEADDLIYAFCHMIREDIVVISNDGDMAQLPYRFNNVKVFNPISKTIIDTPDYDPVTYKCLDGDISDNITGYYGIGKVHAEKFSRDIKALQKLLAIKGKEIYERNRKLIDLSLCPYIAENMTYILKKLSEDTKFNQEAITELVYGKHKIRGIMAEYKSTISPFKLLGDKYVSPRCLHKTAASS